MFSFATDDPDRALSVVNGERQDAAAHVARGGRLAVDIPAFPVPGVPCPARVPMHVGARARVKAVVNDPNASACGRQLDVWWTWEGVLYEARTCHWAKIDVGVGDMLPDWKVAGWMGDSGQAQGVHQHYVLTVGGVVVDPEPYVFDKTVDNPAADSGMSQEQNSGTNGVTSEDAMTTDQRAEIERIAGIFENWAKLRRARDAVADSFGYGINDSLDSREADELESAVDGLRAMLG